MTLAEHVFLYCERGRSEALLAEPFNAASNASFLLAALAALLLLPRRPREIRSADHGLFIALVFLIGLGSLAFHVLADKASMLADVVPIDVFMLVYLGFALNRFLHVPPGWTVLTLIGFAAIVFLAMQLRCWDGGIGFPSTDATGVSECLNGSLVYLPALLAMGLIGGLLVERKHPGAPYILWATLIFAILGDVPLTRSCALRRLRVPGSQDRHPFRLAFAQRACPIPAAAGKPRGWCAARARS